MAQYFTNFDELPVGDVTTSGQTAWTPRISNGTSDYRIIDGGDQDGKFLRINAASTNGSRVLGFNALDGVSDNLETLVKFWIFKSGSDGSTGRYGAAYTRYGGNSEASTIGYAASFVPVYNGKSLALYEDSTGVSQFTNYAWSMSTDYFIRTRISGNDRYVKIWPASSAEPGSWTFSSTATPPTIASPYSGVGTYQRDSYLYVKQYSAGTAGDPAPMFATTDKPQLGAAFILNPPTSAATGGIGGGWGTFGFGDVFGGEVLRDTLITTDRDQTGNARIQVVNDKTQSGNARITSVVSRTQTGNARITAVVSRNQTGNARITQTVSRTQVGNARITQVVSRNQVGNANITSLITTTDRTQTGNANIRNDTTRSQVGNARIANVYSRTQVGNARITAVVSRSQIGNARITQTVTRNQIGNASIFKTVSRTQIGNARIQKTVDQNQVGNARIFKTIDRAQFGNARIAKDVNQNQIGNARIQRIVDQPQTGSALIAREYLKDQTGNARIVKGIDYTIKPVIQIDKEIPLVGSYTIRPDGRAESITRIVTSDKIKQILNVENPRDDLVIRIDAVNVG